MNREGVKTTGMVRCDQSGALDPDARQGRNIDVLPAAILEEVLAEVATIFE